MRSARRWRRSGPQLYFGENLEDWYAIVGTRRAEQGGTAFDGDTGIALDSTWRRAILALGSGDFEPFFSAELTSESQLLYRRDVTERLAAIAPFLTFDADPYPVVTASGVTWVVDGYTTSSTYPYCGVRRRCTEDDVNYAHAAVKATVDAYDGTTHLYRTEIGGDRRSDPRHVGARSSRAHRADRRPARRRSASTCSIHPTCSTRRATCSGATTSTTSRHCSTAPQRWTPAARADRRRRRAGDRVRSHR